MVSRVPITVVVVVVVLNLRGQVSDPWQLSVSTVTLTMVAAERKPRLLVSARRTYVLYGLSSSTDAGDCCFQLSHHSHINGRVAKVGRSVGSALL